MGCVTLTSSAGEIVSREMLCDDTKIIVDSLKETYHEIPVIMGKTGDEAGSVMTIWINPSSETWTIIATNKDYSCVVGSGDKFTVIDYKRKKNI